MEIAVLIFFYSKSLAWKYKDWEIVQIQIIQMNKAISICYHMLKHASELLADEYISIEDDHTIYMVWARKQQDLIIVVL